MDPTVDPVQPEEGQGAGGEGAPYAEYLNRIPEEVRGQVEPVFKDWDSNVTRRFQEASEYRKEWEPYEQAGVRRLPVEELQGLMEFRQALENDPQAVKEWWGQYAQANNLIDQPAAETPPVAEDPYGFQDPGAQMLKQLEDRLSPITQRLEQFASWQESQEQQARVAEANRYLRGQVDELKAANPDDFDPKKAGFDAEELLERFVAPYIESDPHNAVKRAWADVVNVRGQIERATLQAKVDTPAPAEGGGSANLSPEPISTLAQAREIALQQLRANNSQ